MKRRMEPGNEPPKIVIKSFVFASFLAVLGSLLILASILHEPNTLSKSKKNTVSKCIPPSENVPQIVFMVIDAWKYDFLAADNSPMLFLKTQIAKGEAVLLKSNVHVPTVTEPRIKAMTAGINPSFAALMNNFFSSQMSIDNWVEKAASQGKRLLFYGDDTWVRLFPSAFYESVGVPSFNVPDFTEVDNNVTINMRKQIKLDSWDVMILHYLGLDHIGHSQGGESPEIPKKLQEMDNLVKEMFLQESQKRELVIIIIGDHGMTPQGSHGGSQLSETQTPLVILRNKLGIGVRPHEINSIQQIDVSSLMSFFLRQELPSNSLGSSIIPHLKRAWKMKDEEVVFDFLIHINQWSHLAPENELFSFMETNLAENCSKIYEETGIKNIQRFHEETQRIQEKLLSQPQKVGGFQYEFGFLLLLLAVVLIFYSEESKALLKISNLLLLLPILCGVSSSFVEEEHEVWYYCAAGCLILHIWRNFSQKNATYGALILLLHRFAQLGSAGIRRRWIMTPELLPGLLPNDIEIFMPIRSMGDWLHAQLFPISKEHPLIGGVYLHFLVIITLRLRSGTLRKISALLQAIRGVFLLFGANNWHDNIVYISLWLWLPMAIIDPKPGVILFISLISRLGFLPILISTYFIGAFSGVIGLDSSSISCLIGSALFYTGLSNSVSSIDIRVGYAGVQEFNRFIVGAQILANIYGPTIMLFIGHGNFAEILRRFIRVRLAIIVVSTRLLVQFSEHLFIWTVFTPKVLFDIVHCFTLLLLNFIVFLIDKCHLLKM